MRIILQTSLAATACLPIAALAEPMEAIDASSVIIVSALRTPTPVDTVASSLTVLDKRAIDASQAPVVSDLLVRTPGISFTRNGGYGTATSIRIRGAEGDQTVLVIDGVKLADPSSTGGGYNFATLMTGDIDQIEILRGPQSILWGSQAIGGVVSIVTAQPDRPLEASADIEAGSRETVNARAAVGGKSGAVHWRVAGGRFTTDGISAISPRFGGKELDGYTNSTLNGRLGIALSPAFSIDLRGYHAKG
ncbi:outer membrane cobalamin receptor, partial [Sphingobium xenophagum]